MHSEKEKKGVIQSRMCLISVVTNIRIRKYSRIFLIFAFTIDYANFLRMYLNVIWKVKIIYKITMQYFHFSYYLNLQYKIIW